jgi:sugar lactone lactonase YvrE
MVADQEDVRMAGSVEQARGSDSPGGVPRLQADVLLAAGATLGEGPTWDAGTGRLAWVDILGRRLLFTDPLTGETEAIPTPSDIGVAVAQASGGWMCGLADGFWSWTRADGWKQVATVDADRPDLRFNVGKVDPLGRFWAGTMAYDKRPGAGALYRLDADVSVERVLGDVTISNGIVFATPEHAAIVEPGRGHPATTLTCYYIDTPTQRIDGFDVDDAGRLSNRRTVIEIPTSAGSPDGMTLDVEGGLWLALWGGRALRRYVGGRLATVVDVPTSHVSSCAFGGPDYDTLYITSARDDLTPDELVTDELAGALFRLTPGVAGLPPVPFAG